MLVKDDGFSGLKLRPRKRKLDQLLPTVVSVAPPNTRRRKDAPEVPDGSQASSGTHVVSDVSEDADSSGDIAGMPESDSSSQGIEMPQLPPSSGDISVPEESIPYLFSVYNFLRSFSLQLFLSPFGLHDFVGALSCTVQNYLLDAIHVSLMRALKRHLETLSSEGSQPASKCLRHYDWTFLDSLTWPVFLVEYLYLMGYMKKTHEEDFGKIVVESEYYALPVATKLKILQILCDDILDSAELRTELGMRENMAEEKDCDVGDSVPPESTPRRVHPRYSKTSAWNENEAMATSVESNKLNTNSKVIKPDEGAVDAAPDGNSDECCLCGMDGILICCDGCPSAYHSRCIGLNKMLLPDGHWFCPECSVNKLGQTTSRIGRGVRGADVFGIDPYGRMFLGTCNYLLVIETSLNIEPVSRYYNQDDVTKVLSVVCSKGENLSAYGNICMGISKYWEVPVANAQIERTESITNLQFNKAPAKGYVPPSIAAVKSSPGNFSDVGGENQLNNITESSADNREILSQTSDCIGLRGDGSALDDHTSIPDLQNYDMASHGTSTKKTSEATDETSFPRKDELFVTGDATGTVQKRLLFMHNNSSDHVGNGSVVTNVSDLSQPLSAEKSTAIDIATSASGNGIDICRENGGSSVFMKKNDYLSVSNESRQGRHIYSEKCKTISEKTSRIPSSFKPHAYINQYILGDVAASAAATLAVLASEESRVPKAQVYSNPRKAAAAIAALQTKAFSGTAMHFLWPSYEKKLMEVPRERCGWCFTCKSTSTTRRACYLNVAASNAIKLSARNIAGLRPIKYNENYLPVIAAHIANMAETLHGLIIGPFLDAGYTQQWRKQARGATSLRILKSLLLELENNIRGIAFSGDWIKMVDDWSVGISEAPTGMSHSGPNQKRGAGRRSKKQRLASELVQVSPEDSEKNFQWWQGGKFSKIVFQKGALPSSLAKKSARQGGRKRVPGITYPEGSELPRRSRQFAWRASVEMNKNASQLALHVRCLDAHLRWRDLVHPDQSSVEGKGSDFDASVFRNAVICDKRITENKIVYALTFSNQKHLPLRVTKNILEEEITQGENGRLWFSENHIPLYLIKEFEEKDGGKPLPSMPIRSRCSLRTRRKLKSRWGDVFSYLLNKWEKCSCTSCQGDLFLRDAVRCNTCQGNCHKDCTTPSTVHKGDDLEFLFTCSSCYRAKSAALIKNQEALNLQMPAQMQEHQKAGIKCILKIRVPQTVQTIGDGLHAKPATLIMNRETSSGQLSSQGLQSQQKARCEGSQRILKIRVPQTAQPMGDGLHDTKPATLIMNRETSSGQLSSQGRQSRQRARCEGSQRKARSEGSQRKARSEGSQYSGLLWKRKADDDSGINFRLENIVLKSKEGTESLKRPMCCICNMSYHSDLMYIRCERCQKWLHADALNLEEDQIFNLIGFKCGKCRRKAMPKCPYDPDYTKPNMEPLEQMTAAKPSTRLLQSKVEDVVEVDNYPRPTARILEREVQTNGPKYTAPVSHLEADDLVIAAVDPLLPLGRVEPVLEFEVHPNGPASVSQGQQKLSVRRPQIKHETSDDVFYATQDEYSRWPAFSENLQNVSEVKEFSSLEDENFMCAPEYDEAGWDCLDMNFDDMEYEPQTLQQHGPTDANFENANYEPQTWFSFTELLASEDGESGDQYDRCPLTSHDDLGTIYQNPPCSSSGVGEGDSLGAANEPAFDVVACDKCKINKPSPDLTCEVCGLRIHSHCSPWVESEEPTGDGQWRCGCCREWR